MPSRSEKGSVGTEAAIAGPAVLVLMAVMIFAGRMMITSGAVEQAAVDAARAASLERTAAAASNAGETMAEQTLAAQGLNCSLANVNVDTSGFGSPPGQAANVEATVTCVLDLSDLTFPGIPGARTIRASAVSPLDTYRERS